MNSNTKNFFLPLCLALALGAWEPSSAQVFSNSGGYRGFRRNTPKPVVVQSAPPLPSPTPVLVTPKPVVVPAPTPVLVTPKPTPEPCSTPKPEPPKPTYHRGRG